MMRQHLNEFAAVLWGQNCTRGKIMGSTAKNIAPSDNSQIIAFR
jgi:hypothetical protein